MTFTRSHTLILLMALVAGNLFTTRAACSAELKIIAPNAVKEAVTEIGTRFSKDTNIKVVFTWTGSEAIFKRISEGEVYDVVLTTSSGIDRLADSGKLVAQSKTVFARSAVAAAVRPGLPRPDVSSVDGLKKALLDVKSIAISSGPSGRYLEALFEKLGVGADIKSKVKQPQSGVQIGDMLARGEADLGFQQVTELIHAKGFEYLGPLPAEVQNYTIWSAAAHAQASYAKAAMDFVKALAAPSASRDLQRSGLELVSR